MQKKACKQFAEGKQTKDMDYWNHVLWSDETKINLFGSDGVKRVWRQPGEEYKDNCVLPTVNHGGGSVMIWGYMSAADTGELHFIEGTMNANMYILCDILKQSMIQGHRWDFLNGWDQAVSEGILEGGGLVRKWKKKSANTHIHTQTGTCSEFLRGRGSNVKKHGHSMARNAVLVPIYQGTEVTIVTE